VELDHVLIAGTELALPSRPGGRHPGWGTANRIVPLGATYLELVEVVDAAEASASVFGRWVAAAPAGAPFGWAVRVRDLDAVAARRGLAVSDGSRVTPDGRRLTWRLAGVEQAAAEPSLPFFIAWGADTPFPGAGAEAAAVSLELRGDAARIADWLDGHALPITVRAGAPAVLSVTVGTHRFAEDARCSAPRLLRPRRPPG
jgi:hypothetical protein